MNERDGLSRVFKLVVNLALIASVAGCVESRKLPTMELMDAFFQTPDGLYLLEPSTNDSQPETSNPKDSTYKRPLLSRSPH